jgi:Mn-containing catalase
MIIKLLGIIEENTDNQLVKDVHFRSYLAERGTLERLSFYKALEEFKAYCLENRLCVPKYMASIR